MSAKAHYFRIGLFVLLGVFLVVFGVIILGAGALTKKGPVVETYFDESVKGLDVGAPVKYRGVQIGKVRHVGFVIETYKPKSMAEDISFGEWILVEIEMDPTVMPTLGRAQIDTEVLNKRVQAGLRLRLSSSLTGPTMLEADYLKPELYPQLRLAWEPRHPYVPSAPSTMAMASSAVERLAGQIEKLDLNKLFDDVDGLVLSLRESSNRLLALLDDPRISNTITQIESAGTNVATASSELPVLAANLRSSSQQVDEMLKSPEMARIRSGLARTADNTGPTVIQMRKTLTRLDTLLAAGGPQIEAILRDLQKTMASISAVAEDARTNPSRVLLGSPPPQRRTSP